MSALTVRDDFAGAGGWDVALAARPEPLRVFGFETDMHAAATARAAGHVSIGLDVMDVPRGALGALTGYVASPPCQTWSAAGKGAGRAALTHVLQALDLVAAGASPAEAVAAVHDDGLDIRTVLVLHPLAVIRDERPLWVALEQVRTVRPVWEAYAKHLIGWGYSSDTGVLHAEQYGVPQTRSRAVLVAHRERVVSLPKPTHTRYVKGKPRQADGLLPWVSMADALGGLLADEAEDWLMRSNYGTGGDPAARGERLATEPAATVTSKVDRNQWRLRSSQSIAGGDRAYRDGSEPSVTVGSNFDRALWVPTAAVPGDTSWDGPRQSQPGSVRVTLEEAAALQTFPRAYPWQGPKTARQLQVGNAIPPMLASAVLAALLDD